MSRAGRLGTGRSERQEPLGLAASRFSDSGKSGFPIFSEVRFRSSAADLQLADQPIHLVFRVCRPAMTGSGGVGSLDRLPIGKLHLRRDEEEADHHHADDDASDDQLPDQFDQFVHVITR